MVPETTEATLRAGRVGSHDHTEARLRGSPLTASSGGFPGPARPPAGGRAGLAGGVLERGHRAARPGGSSWPSPPSAARLRGRRGRFERTPPPLTLFSSAGLSLSGGAPVRLCRRQVTPQALELGDCCSHGSRPKTKRLPQSLDHIFPQFDQRSCSVKTIQSHIRSYSFYPIFRPPSLPHRDLPIGLGATGYQNARVLLLEGALASKQELGPGSWTWMERDSHIHLLPLWTKNHMVGRESFGRRAGRWGRDARPGH